MAGRIHVTEEIHTALQGEFLFEDRGVIDVKGMGSMKTYFLNAKASNQATVRAS